MATSFKLKRYPSAALLAAVPLLSVMALPAYAATPALAQANDEAVVASLNLPPDHLNCEDAAAQTSVYFNFPQPPFQITQISLYLDGHGVPEDTVETHWPTVTLTSGLHPGRNTVDVVASGASGQTLNRRLVVLVGNAAGGDAVPPAHVACDNTIASTADDDESDEVEGEPEPVVVEPQPRVVVREQPEVVYYDTPVYIYRPYPVVAFDPYVPIIPFFSFGIFYSHYHPYYRPPVVVYHPHRPYRGDPRWHGGGYYYDGHRPDDHRRDDRRDGRRDDRHDDRRDVRRDDQRNDGNNDGRHHDDRHAGTGDHDNSNPGRHGGTGWQQPPAAQTNGGDPRHGGRETHPVPVQNQNPPPRQAPPPPAPNNPGNGHQGTPQPRFEGGGDGGRQGGGGGGGGRQGGGGHQGGGQHPARS